MPYRFEPYLDEKEPDNSSDTDDGSASTGASTGSRTKDPLPSGTGIVLTVCQDRVEVSGKTHQGTAPCLCCENYQSHIPCSR